MHTIGNGKEVIPRAEGFVGAALLARPAVNSRSTGTAGQPSSGTHIRMVTLSDMLTC